MIINLIKNSSDFNNFLEGFIWLSKCNKKQKNDYELVLKAVSCDFFNLEYANPRLRDHASIVLAAIRNHGFAIQYASKRLKNDPKFIIESFNCCKKPQHISYLLNFCPFDITNNQSVMLIATNLYGLSLEYGSESLKDNEKVVYQAVQNNDRALQFMSERLKNNVDFILSLCVNKKSLNLNCLKENVSCQLKEIIKNLNNMDNIIETLNIFNKRQQLHDNLNIQFKKN